MQNQFTATLNELLADADKVDYRGRRMGPAVERVIASQVELESGIAVAVPGNNSPYEVWAIVDAENSLRACFAEAKEMMARSRGDLRALVKIRRAICKKLHPDVVPCNFAGEAEELMKSLNASISSARKAY